MKYRKISELYDEHYMFFIEVFGGDIKVRLACLDPSHQLAVCHRRAISSVMFSATLEPIDYFSDILGGDKSSIKLQLPSPFKQNNLGLFCVDSINTRFEERESSYKKIASCIAATVSGRAGNYLVFFPSYKYMNEVQKEFEKKYPKVRVFAQSTNMNYAQKEEFLANFKEDEGVLRLGFCVLGGSFSEGVDLPGSRLIGTIIVGVGLPGISNERNIMKEYFDNTREGGYDYAYTYPGMNRVLQAAGRVIRTENDRGVVVLLDDRYATEQYKMMFPLHWSHAKYAHSAQELAGQVKEFWKES
jgi:Rad3-related DNA helicase